MDEKTVGMILEKLDVIGAKIGATGEQIWPWLIREQYVTAIYTFVWSLIIGILLIPLCIFTVKYWDFERKGYSISREDHEPFYVAGIGILGFLFLATSFCFLVLAI